MPAPRRLDWTAATAGACGLPMTGRAIRAYHIQSDLACKMMAPHRHRPVSELAGLGWAGLEWVSHWVSRWAGPGPRLGVRLGLRTGASTALQNELLSCELRLKLTGPCLWRRRRDWRVRRRLYTYRAAVSPFIPRALFGLLLCCCHHYGQLECWFPGPAMLAPSRTDLPRGKRSC